MDQSVVPTRALRRPHRVGGGSGVWVNFGWRRGRAANPKKSAVAQRVKFSNFAYMFHKVFSKELLLSRYAC